MALHWIDCHPGYLARSRLGIYMVYQSFDVETGTLRWFAKFETEGQWVEFAGFDSPNDAKQSCDDHAMKFDP
jgi:hypothetical protein